MSKIEQARGGVGMNWIKCSDMLPPDGYALACCSTGNIETACFISGVAIRLVEKGYDVTHWMPLPEQPKDGE